MGLHPCQRCGACCAYFRVEFPLPPVDTPENVPPEIRFELGRHRCCMKGTEIKHRPKCVALKGKVGLNVHCAIYDKRPAPCRNFVASFEDGQRNERCDEARAKHGLSPLTGADWKAFRLHHDIADDNRKFEAEKNLSERNRRSSHRA